MNFTPGIQPYFRKFVTDQRRLIVLLCLGTFSFSSYAQEKLLPDFSVVQLSGSLGQYSAGFGYNIIKNKARVSAHYGLVFENSREKFQVVSTKFFYRPLTVTVWHRVKFNPADVGIITSYVFGSSTIEKNPTEIDKLKNNWWKPGIEAHVALENSLTYEFKKEQRFKSVTGYLEVNTNETYFLNFIRNTRHASLWDILKFGTGVRLTF
jgi:hypothetical protein